MEQRSLSTFGGVAIGAVSHIPIQDVGTKGANGDYEVTWAKFQLNNSTNITLDSIYWQKHWYEDISFSIEFFINAIVKAQSKSDFIMLAGNFNISIGGTINSPF
jgi:hypothetical protein